jgi:predicted DCC family thiol-disulfide oxidoreductase YuxK
MTPGRVTMYFDGGCPLCRREVAHYRRLGRDGQVRWLDISTHSAELVTEGITLDEALARLHVRDRNGELHTGAAGFVVLWAELPYLRGLAQVVRALRLLPVLELAYRPFARWRRRHRRCTGDGCARP